MATIDGNNSELPEISTSDANKVVIVNTTGDDFTLVAQSSISGSIVVDSALSSSSTNPVQNSVVNTALATKITASSDDTLTNKAFNVEGTGNTLFNITNANIKGVGAEINCAKLADGTVSNAEFQTLNGITTSSTIATQLGNKQNTLTFNAPSSDNTNPSTSAQIKSALDNKQDTLTFNAPSSDNTNPSTSAQIKSALDNKQDTLTFNAPSSDNTNPSTSAQIKSALDNKQDTLTFNAPSSDNTNPSTSAQIKSALDLKQNTLTIDTSPADGSTNPITSNAVFDGLALKQNTLTFNAPSSNNTNPSTSAQIKSALDLKQNTLTFNAPSSNNTNPSTSSQIKSALDLKQNSLTFNAPSSDNTNPSTSAQIKSALDLKQNSLTFNAPSSDNTNPSTSAQIKSALDNKQDTLTFNAPSSDNTNPSTSAQIKSALDNKQDSLTFNAPSSDNTNPSTSAQIKSALDDKQDTIDSSNKLASANINFSTDIAVNEDGTNARSTFNFTSIGTRSATGQADAMMCHKNFATDSNSYAIVQLDTGKTIVNSKSGTNLELRNGDSLIGEVATDGIGVKAGSFGRSQFNNTLIGNKSTPSNDTSCIIMHSAFAANNTNNVNSYALFQNSSGTTAVNCRTGANLAFRVNNADKLLLTGTTGQLTGSAISTSFDSSTSANQLASVGAIRDYVTANAGGSTGPKVVAYGKFNGTNGNLIRGLGLTCNRTAAGNYTMTLGSARPTADYSVFFSVIELLNNRDDLIITANNGSFTTTTFQLILTEQDNGTAGGQFRDKDFCVQVVDHD